MLFQYGDQNVNRDRDPNLRFDRVLGSAEKGFYSQVLFYPLEEKFYLPTTFIEMRDNGCGEHNIVCEKDENFSCLRVVESDAPKFL